MKVEDDKEEQFSMVRVVYMNTGYGTELIGHTHL